jgi:hypothetical protein
LFEPEEAPLERSRSRLHESVDRAVSRGKMTGEEAEGLVGRIAYTTDIADLDGVEAVMEAVPGDPRVKGKLFASLDEQLPDAQFLASNTSSIPIAPPHRSRAPAWTASSPANSNLTRWPARTPSRAQPGRLSDLPAERPTIA